MIEEFRDFTLTADFDEGHGTYKTYDILRYDYSQFDMNVYRNI